MTKFTLSLITLSALISLLLFPANALARNAVECNPACVSGSYCDGGVCSCASDCTSGCHSDGSCQITGNNIQELGAVIGRVINFLFAAIGGVAVIMIAVGGVRYILASGDPKGTDSAKQTIQFAVIGLVVVLLAVLIVNVIGNFLGVSNLNVVHIGVSP